MNLISDDTTDLVIHELDGLAGLGLDGVALCGVCGFSEPALDDAVLTA